MTETQTITKHEKNLSAFIHASTFSKYFIPMGNFILPLILWTANRKEKSFVDYNGKQALNFQISMFLYSVLLGAVSIPFFISTLPMFFEGGHFNFSNVFSHNDFNFNFGRNGFPFTPFLWPLGISGLLFTALAIINFVYTILATIRTSEGQQFKYPITINFIK